MTSLILPIGRTFSIPHLGTTVKDLEDLAYRSDRGRSFKPTLHSLVYVVKPNGQTEFISADGETEIAEIQEMAQRLVEGGYDGRN